MSKTEVFIVFGWVNLQACGRSASESLTVLRKRLNNARVVEDVMDVVEGPELSS